MYGFDYMVTITVQIYTKMCLVRLDKCMWLCQFFSADGKYEMTSGTKAILNYTGRIQWRPPASFKSNCDIDVRYFPFDNQTCTLEFGSWTYNTNEVK